MIPSIRPKLPQSPPPINNCPTTTSPSLTSHQQLSHHHPLLLPPPSTTVPPHLLPQQLHLLLSSSSSNLTCSLIYGPCRAEVVRWRSASTPSQLQCVCWYVCAFSPFRHPFQRVCWYVCAFSPFSSPFSTCLLIWLCFFSFLSCACWYVCAFFSPFRHPFQCRSVCRYLSVHQSVCLSVRRSSFVREHSDCVLSSISLLCGSGLPVYAHTNARSHTSPDKQCPPHRMGTGADHPRRS
jgi:hypothetical protein